MSCVTTAFHPARENSGLPVGYQEPCWYAVYTNPNHEKRVAAQFAGRGVEHFLPLYETVHRWKDRRMRVELPLFPSYIFVHLPLGQKLRVLQVPGVVRLVGFGEHAASLPTEEIEMLRNGLSGELNAHPHPYLTEGRRVRITNGPLAGMEGVLMRQKSNFRLILSIDLIMRSIAVDVDAADVRPLNTLGAARKNNSVEFRAARPLNA
ncbi:MAG TPA: UpxY family transcription antiterminator [Candidatus Acidoferrales bacterium]|nr:UpxY family transcription antiterminator [Candidatus Acidoferrales bacterium]